ncbi:MAG: dihydrofolate reductase [Megasphaera sp.]|uniref:dihydrofolate reductase n=1 Tax=Megasphaera sp. TaxID=2023260 RepID=UPI003F0361BA
MIHLIAAIDQKGGIGKDNDLLCHISADLKRFKSLTMGHTMIMGRKTFESLPGVLPGRPHWVLTHQEDYRADSPAVTVFHSLAEVQQAMQADEDYFVIGGAAMYREFLPLAGSLYLTEIDETFPDADTFFPEWKKEEWQETARESHPADGHNKHPFSFVHYVRPFD